MFTRSLISKINYM